MASIDLKDAYYLIRIASSSRKYLRFRFANVLYEFNCLSFGLCTAPYTFTKILKPVISYLREWGYLSVIYLDDLLLLGETHASCLENVQKTVSLLESLGFIINKEKCKIESRRLHVDFWGSRMIQLRLLNYQQIKKRELAIKFRNSVQVRSVLFENSLGL